MDVVDPTEYCEALRDIVREQPATVAEARRIVTDPQLAATLPEDERQASWDLTLEEFRLRRARPAAEGDAA